MFKVFISICLGLCFLISSLPSSAIEINNKAIEKLNNKVSKKFSRTFCNTSKFGISSEGALEFAIGETNKEFLNNKYVNYLNPEDLKNTILSNIQEECQFYDFPSDQLVKLNFLNTKNQ